MCICMGMEGVNGAGSPYKCVSGGQTRMTTIRLHLWKLNINYTSHVFSHQCTIHHVSPAVLVL